MSNDFSKHIDLRLLRFRNPELEEAFLKQFAADSRLQSASAVLLAGILYGVFSILDQIIVGEAIVEALIVRIFVIILLLLLWRFFPQDPDYRHIRNIGISASILTCGGILVILYLSDPIGQLLYYSGINLVIVSALFLANLRFWIAMTLSLSMIVAYLVQSAFIMNLDTIFLTNNLFFMFGTYILAGSASYTTELRSREAFYQRRRIEEAQSELAIAKGLAEKSALDKSNFLATMSHELRTPMNGVLGMVRLALMERDLGEDVRHKLEIAERSGEVLRRLINEVLDISRIEAGKLEFRSDEVILEQIIDDVVVPVAPTAKERGITLSVSVDDRIPSSLIGDSIRLKQVLINVVGNALKFTNDGEISIRVELRDIDSRAARIEFTVRDTGIGIPPEDLGRIFEPMSQASNAGQLSYAGTGLGLAVARQLVAAMGGQIQVTSQVGVGTTMAFDVTLAIPTAETPRLTANQTIATLSTEPKRILIVEDDEINQLVVVGFLKKQRHLIEIAECGEQAIIAARQAAFDVILLDMRLPDMDGLSVAKAIGEWEQSVGRSTPIVALTANVLSHDIKAYREAGILCVVQKPIDPVKLFEAISDAVSEAENAVTSYSLPTLHAETFDLKQLENMIAVLGEERVSDLARRLENSLKISKNKLDRAVASTALQDVSYHAHRLAGVAANFALPDLQECASVLEDAARCGKVAKIRQQYQVVIGEISRTLSAVRELQGEMPHS